MRSLIASTLILVPLSLGAAEKATSLEELVKRAREERVLENQALAKREEQFRAAHDQQQAWLDKLRAELAVARKRGEALKLHYEDNLTVLKAKSTELAEKAGSFGEIFGVARQVAKDTQSLLASSLVSAQKPNREDLPARIVERKENPSIDEIEQLWLLLLDEMLESGRVASFKTVVTVASGEQREQEVVRVGAFNAFSGGHYLNYLPETERMVELGRQPPERLQSLARAFEGSKSALLPVALDPSRGSILALLVESPGFIEHIQKAGAIGYLILGLGGLALLIVGERFTMLSIIRRRLENEKKSATPSGDNALGRLRLVCTETPGLDADTLALKLDQAMVGEVPRFRRWLPSLAVFATAAPLLGLLGTVAGMIDTFQTMSLFGAGDPKIVSGGISLALVATELGLVVAIPILLLHSWLHGLSNRLIQSLEEEVAALVSKREEQLHGVAA
ncbi:MAG: MotA/TolQ/ExbB proton channel family protein [Gammaproteobacteria bacterium]